MSVQSKRVRWADMELETEDELNGEINMNEKNMEASAAAATREDEEEELEGAEVIEGFEEEDVQSAGDVRTMKKMIDPKLPSKEDIMQHEMTLAV